MKGSGILNNEKLESISSRTNKPVSMNQLKENRPKSIEDANSGRNSNYEIQTKILPNQILNYFQKFPKPNRKVNQPLVFYQNSRKNVN